MCYILIPKKNLSRTCWGFGNWEVFSTLTYDTAVKDQGLKNQLIPSSKIQAIGDWFIFLRSYLSDRCEVGVLFREHKKMLMEDFCQKIHIHQKNNDGKCQLMKNDRKFKSFFILLNE